MPDPQKSDGGLQNGHSVRDNKAYSDPFSPAEAYITGRKTLSDNKPSSTSKPNRMVVSDA